ncbi:MAG: TRAP transporter fused permease subunit, partial [Pseudomonadota bacterium]|nr:TRAP transporter fused permease subunit [Pseudomonadota bacterium]
YCYFGHLIPWGMLSHRGFTAIQILDHMYLTLEGIWGVALGVAAAYIVLFIIFGAVAEKAGTADFCIDFANAVAGHTRGGPAKVAIFSSALIGSVSGSSVANVYTTGQFTIPMMKKLGYKPKVAGAIEALASNGGQIMPPVLGAAAFLIAAYTGMPYYQIALASLIPAMLYFLGLYWYIHLEAHKTNLVGIPKNEKPSVAAVLLQRGHLFLPLILLIALLAYGYSPIKSAFYAIVGTVALSWLRKDTRMWPKDILRALEAGARSSVMIIVTCAVVGFIIGAFTLTGLALNLGSAIIALAGGQFFLILVFIGLACIVLGMGMNTVAAFVLVSVIAVPALLTQGVDKLTANMFVFYFSILSHITPPVCLAVFAAASIAQAGPWQTAMTGVKMGSIAYILPFLVVFAPSLLLLGTPTRIAIDAGTALIGAMFLISAIQGWLFTRMNVTERLISFAAGVLLLWPNTKVSLVGAVLCAVVIAISFWKSRGTAPATKAVPEDGGAS